MNHLPHANCLFEKQIKSHENEIKLWINLTINIVNTNYAATCIDKQNKMKLEKLTFVCRSFKLDKHFVACP